MPPIYRLGLGGKFFAMLRDSICTMSKSASDLGAKGSKAVAFADLDHYRLGGFAFLAGMAG